MDVHDGSAKSPETALPDFGVPMAYKLGALIRSAYLDQSTARYVVSSPLITGLPTAGKQGLHRVFDIPAASKVILATWLVTSGYSLEDANWLCDLARNAAFKEIGRGAFTYLWPKAPGSHWILEIVNCQFYAVFLQGPKIARKAKREYRAIRPAPDEVDQMYDPDHHVVHRFDLTLMESRLLATPDTESTK